MLKNFFILIIGILCLQLVSAQSYEGDILRFSSHNFSGNARFVAVGGAFTSVGADLSNLSYNPGGIGMFRNSVAQVSLGVQNTQTKSNYVNETSSDQKTNVIIPNFAFVFASKKVGSNRLFRGTSYGIAFNRLGDFQYKEKIAAYRTEPFSSISWNWVKEMSDTYNGAYTNETSLNDVSFETYTGFYGYLVNFDSALLDYSSPVVDSFQQSRYVDVKGSKNEMLIAIGSNFLDKWYFGASLGIPILSYERSSKFLEKDKNNASINTFFNEFTLEQDYKTEGLGFNFKLGTIYAPVQWLRLGLAFQTPERMSMTERYSSVLTSNMDFGTYEIETGEGTFDYVMRLPWRMQSGLSFIIKKNGFIAVDYEAVGYSSMRYSFDTDYAEIEDAINANIKAKYKVGHQLRVGGEVVIKKLRLRAGYHFTSSPLKTSYAVKEFNFSRQAYSGGFGFMFDKFAIDFAYQHAISKQFELAYEAPNLQSVGIQRTLNRGMGIVSFSYKLN
jgi:long-subunit fatty acid transport protein